MLRLYGSIQWTSTGWNPQWERRRKWIFQWKQSAVGGRKCILEQKTEIHKPERQNSHTASFDSRVNSLQESNRFVWSEQMAQVTLKCQWRKENKNHAVGSHYWEIKPNTKGNNTVSKDSHELWFFSHLWENKALCFCYSLRNIHSFFIWSTSWSVLKIKLAEALSLPGSLPWTFLEPSSLSSTSHPHWKRLTKGTAPPSWSQGTWWPRIGTIRCSVSHWTINSLMPETLPYSFP